MSKESPLNKETRTIKGLSRRLAHWKSRDFLGEVRAAVSSFSKVVRSLPLSTPIPARHMRALEAAERGYRRAFGDFVELTAIVRNPTLTALEEEVLDSASEKESMEVSSVRLRKFLSSLLSTPSVEKKYQRAATSYARRLASGDLALSKPRFRAVRPLLENISALEHSYSRALERERKFVFFRKRSSLSGLSKSSMAAFRAHARAMGRKGWALPLEETVDQESASMLHRPRSRRRVLHAARSRGDKVRRIARKLARARLLAARAAGRASWAELRAASLASASTEAAWGLLHRAAQRLLPAIARAKPSRQHRPRPSPSFDPHAVLERGCFHAARRLFGLRVSRVKGTPLYHPSVRLYRVARADGRCLGFITSDLLSRLGKSDGAWTSCWEDVLSPESYPVVGIFCNLSPRTTFSGVEDIFHEFGHALHALLASSQSVFSSALTTPNDLVEVPSLLAESWALWPDIYSRIRSPSSPALSETLRWAGDEGKAVERMGDVLSSATDLVWHGEKIPLTNAALRSAVSRKLGLPRALEASPSYSEDLFPHIFCSDYDSTYFSYLWCGDQASRVSSWLSPSGAISRAKTRRLASVLKQGSCLESGDFCAALGLR